MKVLVLTANLSTIGGIQRYGKDIIKAIEELGHEVCVVEKKTGLLDFILQSFSIAFSFNPDIIFCGHINFSPICLILKMFSFRFVILTYGIEVWEMGLLDRFGIRKAFRILTISSFTEAKILKQEESSDEKIFILPNAVHYPKAPSPAVVDLKKLYGENVVLSVCRLAESERYKGYDRVIQAMPSVLKIFPDAKYIIVGDGNDIPRIEKMIFDLKVKKNVFLVGFVSEDELNDYYDIAKVFILPSTGEGFGFVYLEALVRGKSVIAGNKDGSTDALLDGRLGLLIDPESISQIGIALTSVLKKDINPQLLNPTFLKDTVLQNFGYQKFKNRLQNFFDTLNPG